MRAFFPVLATGVAVCIFYTSTHLAAQQQAQVDLRAVAAAAYGYSPELKAARHQLRGVQELYPQALANYQPQINASAGINNEQLDQSNFGGGADGATTKDVGVTLDQPLYRGGRSRAQKNEAKARIDAQKAALDAAGQRVAADAMSAAVAAHAAIEQLRVQAATERLYTRLVEDTDLRQQGGEATSTDRALAESRRAGITADRLAAESNLQEAGRGLLTLTGRPPAQWDLAGDPAPVLALPQIDLPKTADEAVAIGRQDNPDRKFLIAMADADNHGVEMVKGELLPQLRFLARWLREWDPAPGIIDEATSRQAGLRLTVPLYEGGGTRSRVRQAKNRVAESRFALQDFDLQLEQDIRDTWLRRETARARGEVLAAQMRAAELARGNTETEILAGERTMTDLLQADQTWLEAQMDAVAAGQQETAATVELMRLLGRLSPQDLGLTVEDPDEYFGDVRHRMLSSSLPD